MNKKQLICEDSIIHYKTYGEGPRVIIAFHGFDQNYDAYDFLKSDLFDKNFTIYSIALFFHGSQYSKKLNFNSTISLSEIKTSILRICETENIDSFCLLGYSIGGRIALSLAIDMYDRVNYLYVIAPDGIVTNFWYYLSTSSLFGRAVFYNSHKFTETIKKFTKLGVKLGFVKNLELKALYYGTATSITYKKVINTWLLYRKIKTENWKEVINAKNLNALFFFGKYDKLIDEKSVMMVKKSLNDSNNIMILDSGHNMLQKKYTGVLVSSLIKTS